MELNFYFKFFFFHFPIIPGSRIFDIDKLSRVSQIQYSDFVIVLGPEAHATTEGQVKTAPPTTQSLLFVSRFCLPVGRPQG